MSTDEAYGGATPGPPWRTRVDALLWWHRAVPAAGDATPLGGLPAVWLTVGAFVRYHRSPVGPYSEVFASPLLVRVGRTRRPAVTVPFIAVDSEPSRLGGREHWQLPKELATFEGGTTDRRAAAGPGWSIAASVSRRWPALPVAGVLPAVQPPLTSGGGVDRLTVGSYAVRLAGLARPARVELTVDGPRLQPWLLSGSHRCVVVRNARMTVGVPRPEALTP